MKKKISSSILNIIYFPLVVQGGKELKWNSLISEKEAYVTNKLIKLKWEQKLFLPFHIHWRNTEDGIDDRLRRNC